MDGGMDGGMEGWIKIGETETDRIVFIVSYYYKFFNLFFIYLI